MHATPMSSPDTIRTLQLHTLPCWCKGARAVEDLINSLLPRWPPASSGGCHFRRRACGIRRNGRRSSGFRGAGVSTIVSVRASFGHVRTLRQAFVPALLVTVLVAYRCVRVCGPRVLVYETATQNLGNRQANASTRQSH